MSNFIIKNKIEIYWFCGLCSYFLNTFMITNRKTISALSSPEKEDRYYTTRGSTGVGFDESSSSRKVLTMESKKESNNKTVWPRLYTTLSSKEKEEDFMAMKGCKLPQRPKKRAKMIQRTLLVKLPYYPFHFS